jgi:hypothetical protein
MNIIEAIEEYQCPGCVDGCKPVLREACELGVGCQKHSPGTRGSAIGLLFLGMPKGFNRLGPKDRMTLQIYESYEQKMQCYGDYNIYNVPCWKHLDQHGNTLVRGLSPRINMPFLHVILGDCRDSINCREILKEDLEKMD